MAQVQDKATQLRAHKRLATGLFLLMAGIYAGCVWLARNNPAGWIGYVQAFSEAAMVGALADWFAVTALFHHPLGLPIPHTNLIERSKQNIGNNLGAFVVANFLNPATIRPYISKLRISAYAAKWLKQEKNKQLLAREAGGLVRDILGKMDDDAAAKFLARRGRGLLEEIKLNGMAASALEFFVEKGGHQQFVTVLAAKLSAYIRSNPDMVRERVKQESYFFIPSFVDNKLAEKITKGLASYFEDIANDPEHRLRAEATSQLAAFAQNLRYDPAWMEQFQSLSNHLLGPEQLAAYAAGAWASIKSSMAEELANEDSSFFRYINRSLSELAESLEHDPVLQQKVDSWIRHTAYRMVLRNGPQLGALISNTVGNWQGRELSHKLELEVGKDLQFIRINGTLVGGLVGLLIYVLTRFLG